MLFFFVWMLLHLFNVCSFTEYFKCFESPQQQQQQQQKLHQIAILRWILMTFGFFKCERWQWQLFYALDFQCNFRFFSQRDVALCFWFVLKSALIRNNHIRLLDWVEEKKDWNLVVKTNQKKHVLFSSCA